MEGMESDNQLVYYALNMWANYIETGENHLNANDIEAMGKHAPAKLRALDMDKMKMIIRLRELAQKFLSENWCDG